MKKEKCIKQRLPIYCLKSYQCHKELDGLDFNPNSTMYCTINCFSLTTS